MADGARGRRRRKESSIRRAVTKHGWRTKAAEVERAEFQREALGDAEAAAGATIFECLSGETLCMPKPFQDAVPSSSRSKVSAAPATTTSPRSTGRRTRSMGYLPPHPGRYSEQLHHLAQPLGGHPECGRFGEFNGSDARPVRLQVPARANVKTIFPAKLLIHAAPEAHSLGPTSSLPWTGRRAGGFRESRFSARRTVENPTRRVMRRRPG